MSNLKKKKQKILPQLQMHLQRIIHRFRESISLPIGIGHLIPSESPIQGIILNGSVSVTRLSGHLNARGFLVRAFCSPTVAVGQERVRICLHGHNTVAQIDNLVKSIHDFFSTDCTKPKL